MVEILAILLVLVLGIGVMLGLAVAIGALSSLLRGWVLSILWGWFMVPTFGLPELGVVPAIGMMFTITFLFQYSKISSDISAARSKPKKSPGPKNASTESAAILEEAVRIEKERKQEEKEVKMKFVSLLVNLFVGPFFSLFFGWIIHMFM
ncbi:MAG: hypothetical protein G01um101420_780 [Parcubacteria group bacterium Gr01-1014_20]|nr:MAG: hypothetical protein G01um101420_780 [Parcubacteria group bacterium Gr01-1014_20]